MTDLRELFLPDSLIRKSLKQPLYRIPAPWEFYPKYGEEILKLISIMPRQSFEFPDNIALQSVDVVERFSSDEKLKMQWIVICHYEQEISPHIAGLFYKIETLIIRPLLKKQGSDLRACFPIGTFEEIADAINFTGDSLVEIEEALFFGSRIGIEIRIREQSGKKGGSGKTPLAEHSTSFRLFQSRVSKTDFAEENEPTGNIFAEDICYLFPTCSYADLINTNTKTERGVEKGKNLSILTPLALRLWEVLGCKGLVDGQGEFLSTDGAFSSELSIAELAELMPLKDQSKLDELLKEIEELKNHQG